MIEWHYSQGGKQLGPVTGAELKSLATQGRLKPTDLVWKDGMADWVPANQVHGLFDPSVAPPSSSSPAPPAAQPAVARAISGGQRRCHEVDYEIHGDDMQVVEVELDPGETVIAEAGAMNYMEDGITFEAKMGDGSKPDAGFFGKVLDGAKRAVTGESIFLTHFTHTAGTGKRRVAFAGPYPGKIMALDLARLGGRITCQKDAFLAAALGTEVGIEFNKRLGTGFFGGEGFILQKLVGDGMAFIHAGGHIVKRELDGEVLRVDTGCLVGFTPGIDYNIERAGNLKSMIFGGEGLFLATLRGQGTVWLQTLPFSRMANRIIAGAPRAGGSRRGEGSILGGLGDIFGDS
jgi:uncharacterized protein (TIGR00266 family)